MINKKIIVWDLGATKCAAAVVAINEAGALTCLQESHIKIRSCQSLFELNAQIEKELNITAGTVDAICIGAAGQFNGEYLQLEKGLPDQGYPYPMHFAKLANHHRWPAFSVIHDYSPIVCATFTESVRKATQIRRLNQAPINPHGRRVALGIGTGIGVKDGVQFENGDFWLGTNEMGHIGVTTPPLAKKIHRERHNELIKFLIANNMLAEDEPLTFEKLLAGPGMVRIHAFFDAHAKDKTAEEIGELVRAGKATETLATFAWYLGLLIGTVQLSFMPDGGIWLTGGVIDSHPELFDDPEFTLGIHASPNYLQLREQLPLTVLCGNQHAFMGAAFYAHKRLLT